MRFTVNEEGTRSEVSFERDGSVKAARWCAGCHDPVPFYSGAFDDKDYDDVHDPTAHAGITCTVCHAITHVNSTKGNADYTIDEPIHYPFAKSDNALLQWVNNQLVKAKPAMHKKTFLKDFHRDAEFCSSCHKVHLPKELTAYKEFLRGQNHYDPFLLSGVSGHGARSFYYPAQAKESCASCHMPLKDSADFGARRYDDTGRLTVHDHLFPAANTGLAWLKDRGDVIEAHTKFLTDITRVDIFGIRDGAGIDGPLHAPLRPSPVFEKKNALPRSERRRAADDGNREMRLGERRANMRGHIVRTFGVMDIAAVFRREAREDGFKIRKNVGVGVFRDQQRRRRVTAKDREEPFGDAIVPNEIDDSRGDFVKTLATRVDP
jgi:hypothetical protein